MLIEILRTGLVAIWLVYYLSLIAESSQLSRCKESINGKLKVMK